MAAEGVTWGDLVPSDQFFSKPKTAGRQACSNLYNYHLLNNTTIKLTESRNTQPGFKS